MSRRNGFVLISVVLVLALASGIVMTLAMQVEQRLDRVSASAEQRQIFLICLSGEQLAHQVLQLDQANSRFDHEGEQWAFKLPPFQVDGFQVQPQLYDAQRKLNFNQPRLRSSTVSSGAELSNPYGRRAILGRALKDVGDASQTEALYDALLDWQDMDDAMRTNGAESLSYQRFEPFYRAANMPLSQTEELHLIMGFTPAVVRALTLHADALPDAADQINVNTASPDVLAWIIPEADQVSLAQLLERRRSDPWFSLGAFFDDVRATVRLDNEALFYDTLISARSPPITVSSNYFELITEVQIGERITQCQSLLKRSISGEGKVMVIRRNYQRSPKSDPQ